MLWLATATDRYTNLAQSLSTNHLSRSQELDFRVPGPTIARAVPSLLSLVASVPALHPRIASHRTIRDKRCRWQLRGGGRILATPEVVGTRSVRKGRPTREGDGVYTPMTQITRSLLKLRCGQGWGDGRAQAFPVSRTRPNERHPPKYAEKCASNTDRCVSCSRSSHTQQHRCYQWNTSVKMSTITTAKWRFWTTTPPLHKNVGLESGVRNPK